MMGIKCHQRWRNKVVMTMTTRESNDDEDTDEEYDEEDIEIDEEED